MLKIVLDTNSLIDAAGDDYNFNNRIIDEVFSGKIEAYANRQTLAENRHMASRKISDPVYLEKINHLLGVIKEIENETRLDVVEDWQDNKILESAVDSGSEYLVTSDNHLLKLSSYGRVKIVTPAQFWSLYEQENGSGWRNWLDSFIRS